MWGIVRRDEARCAISTLDWSEMSQAHCVLSLVYAQNRLVLPLEYVERTKEHGNLG